MPPSYRTLAARRLRRVSRYGRESIARRKARRAAPHGACLILYYHRIASPVADPWRTSVAPDSFDRQLEYLDAETRILPLQEMVEAARRGSLPDRAVAITFDDGYVDNLEQGLPILERRRLPATFYVATGFLGTPGPPWWDEIADLMVGPGERPETLDLRVGRGRIQAPTGTLAQRDAVLHGELNPMLKSVPGPEVEATLEPLRAWAGRSGKEAGLSEDPVSETRLMTTGELEQLAASELAEIGAHTSLHPSLPTLGADAQRQEIFSSRDRIGEICGALPRSFAYPFGDQNRHVREAVRTAGFDHAVVAESTLPFTLADDEFSIPRLVAHDEGAEDLVARIDQAFELIRPS